MKNRVQKMILWTVCLMMILSVPAGAETRVRFGIQRDSATLRMDGFTPVSGMYKIVMFTEADFGDESLWICIDSEQYGPEGIKSRMEFDDLPKAEPLAVKMFERDSEGQWKESFELTKSSLPFAEPDYQAAVEKMKETELSEVLDETDKSAGTDEKIHSGKLELRIKNEIPEKPEYYILIEEDQTVLPLNLAAEFYGFTPETGEQTLTFFYDQQVFSECPMVFVRRESEDEIELLLEACQVEIIMPEEVETIQTEMETEMLTETETVTETEMLTETEVITETEILMETEAVTETEMLTETEAVTETEILTEMETVTETEILTETETVTETEILTETETVTETEILTETETDTETEILTETEIAVVETNNSGKNILILGFAGAAIAAAVVILIFTYKQRTSAGKNGQSTEKKEMAVFREDSEDTVKPMEISGKSIWIQGAVINNKGRVRGNNEDNFYLNGAYMKREKMDDGASVTIECKDHVQLYAVCDGMGGADCGEEASHCAVKKMFERREEHYRMTDASTLTDILRSISDDIYSEAKQKGQKSGTTITMLAVNGEQVIFANVGDSRTYRLRNKKMSQISLDHSKVQRMISMGMITPEQAKKDPARHVITQYMGMPTDIRISPYLVTNEPLQKDDVYVLCSDGLTDMVEDSRIEMILREKKKPREAAQELLKCALNNGGRDNVTIMVLRVMGIVNGDK